MVEFPSLLAISTITEWLWYRDHEGSQSWVKNCRYHICSQFIEWSPFLFFGLYDTIFFIICFWILLFHFKHGNKIKQKRNFTVYTVRAKQISQCIIWNSLWFRGKIRVLGIVLLTCSWLCLPFELWPNSLSSFSFISIFRSRS